MFMDMFVISCVFRVFNIASQEGPGLRRWAVGTDSSGFQHRERVALQPSDETGFRGELQHLETSLRGVVWYVGLSKKEIETY